MSKELKERLRESFRFLNPRKGTETQTYRVGSNFQLSLTFRFLNPRKGTETGELSLGLPNSPSRFPLPKSPQGD